MKRLLLPVLLASLFGAAPALACSYTQIPEEVGDASAQFLARRMVAAAAHVDLVLLEDDGTRPMDEKATGVLTLRSIARLKGGGPDRFSLFGGGLTLQPEAERVFAAPLQHFTGDDGRVTPFSYNEERQGQLFPQSREAPPGQLSSCSPNPIAGQTGRFYVVMRGTDGRLLGDYAPYEGVRARAFAFVPVRLDRDDHWLRAVRIAALNAGASGAPAVVHLRAGVDAVRLDAALRRAGITPVAAFVRSGEWLDEIQPADHEARSPWLARAVPLVPQRNRGGLGVADHGAAEFLRSRLSFEQAWGGVDFEVAQAFINSVRRRQVAKAAPPQLVAVALTGAADAIAAFSRSDMVDGVRPLASDEQGLLQLPGQSEAERFAAMQAIQRDIWLLNGGAGNTQGTLPDRPR